jgi:hypothetical protein
MAPGRRARGGADVRGGVSRRRWGARAGGARRARLPRPGDCAPRRPAGQGGGWRSADVASRPAARDGRGGGLSRGPVPAVLGLGGRGQSQLGDVVPEPDAVRSDAAHQPGSRDATKVGDRERGTRVRLARRSPACAGHDRTGTGEGVRRHLEDPDHRERRGERDLRRALARRSPLARVVLADRGAADVRVGGVALGPAGARSVDRANPWPGRAGRGGCGRRCRSSSWSNSP